MQQTTRKRPNLIVRPAPTPVASTRGWTSADYEAAGVTGRDAQRMCRRVWLPPQVASVLLGDAAFTVQNTEALARMLPMNLLQDLAVTGWAGNLDTLAVQRFLSDHGVAIMHQWVLYGGGTVGDALLLADRDVQVGSMQSWAATHRVADPAAVLAGVLPGRLNGFGAIGPANTWLDVAVRSCNVRQWRSREPLDIDSDLLVGGRSGLYAAAGVAADEALFNETGQKPTLHDLNGLVTLAALRGFEVPPAAWWALQ